VSYVWGSGITFFPVNGVKVSITGNLQGLFTHVSCFRARRIWVDALCINQADPEEKAWQTGLMATIYKRASWTFAWLGNGNDDTSQAMLSLRNMTHKQFLEEISLVESEAEALARRLRREQENPAPPPPLMQPQAGARHKTKDKTVARASRSIPRPEKQRRQTKKEEFVRLYRSLQREGFIIGGSKKETPVWAMHGGDGDGSFKRPFIPGIHGCAAAFQSTWTRLLNSLSGTNSMLRTTQMPTL